MKNNLKIVFLGNPEFALPSLEALLKENYQIIGVITAPDKPVGRKQILTPPPVKVLAQKYGLLVYQPKDKAELLEIIKNLQPDLAVAAAFGMIFPKEILNIPKYGFINIHPSPLPRYRGPTPIQTAILNGDEETGVSLFLIDEKMDHGPILAQSKIQILESETYQSLHDKLAKSGAELLIKLLPSMEALQLTGALDIDSVFNLQPQDESKATYTKKFSTQDAYIEPKDLEKAQSDGGQIAIQIDRKIRALNPEPGVWTIKDGKRMKILEAELMPDKILKLKKIQFEGKKPIFVK
jgi:methionyl-tRNA formyltransferase